LGGASLKTWVKVYTKALDSLVLARLAIIEWQQTQRRLAKIEMLIAKRQQEQEQ